MHIIAVGLNYRTAPVEIREQFAFDERSIPLALQQLKDTKSILECVIVSTCNRTEIYAVVDRLYMCGHYVRSFLESWFGIPRERMKDYLYIHEDQRAIEHLLRVTCGLDSMVIGETQILGQIRDAFLNAQQQKATGTLFNMLFKQAVTLAKRAHSETSIGENPVSVSYAAVELGKRIFGNFGGKTVLIVGAGKMSELTLRHLKGGGADKVVVVNRTYEKAAELAEKVGGIARRIEQLGDELACADIVISSTGAPGYVLTREAVAGAMRGRRSRPLFMIDIAVPRDMDPGIAHLSNVYLYDIDDLELIVETNLNERRKEAAKIGVMIDKEIEAFNQWYKLLGVSPVIRALQDKASVIHEETMASLLNKLPELGEREVKLIHKLSKSMLNQMMRDPIMRIKELAGERKGEEAIGLFTDIFGLDSFLEEAEASQESNKTVAKAEVSAPKQEVFHAEERGRKQHAALAAGELLAGT
ncbi:glutamyl-tRNA reductase [Paenibacillus ginsengarvi]|uniref:Glutamyl-tRNA reductase n=1 Tax=Paenibacillus ginsengarvi TaxID=400777 RepID=A0A3B0CEU3_9BACL|nr:glutamyl-tRNA reductase [Paenibacillus ginsengarvi]RKN83870.1 glutamyl-tRNA reductase [Paenibacillus ginsengarvi]